MNKKLALFFIVSSIIIAGCSTTSTQYRRSFVNGNGAKSGALRLSDDQYMVKQGDTLFSIAFMNGMDYRTLALINNIDLKTSIIHPGDILTVKIKGLNSKNVYRVRSGDTLYSIARKHHKSIDQLAKINKITPPYTINLGQLIILDNKKSIYDRAPAQVKPVNSNVVAANKPSDTESKNSKVNEKAVVVNNSRQEYNKQSKLSWKWPTNGTIVRNFASKNSSGLDIAGKKGQNIVSAANGKVVYAGNALRGYGNLIIIKHNDDYLSAYAHNDQLLVKETQKVKAGQVIAKMGNTDSDRVNLHFEIRYRGEAVNPYNYLPKK